MYYNQEDAVLDQLYDSLQEVNINIDSDEGSTIGVDGGWGAPSPPLVTRKRSRPKGSKITLKNAAIQLGSEVQGPPNQGSEETLVQPPQDISNYRITRMHDGPLN